MVAIPSTDADANICDLVLLDSNHSDLISLC